MTYPSLPHHNHSHPGKRARSSEGHTVDSVPSGERPSVQPPLTSPGHPG